MRVLLLALALAIAPTVGGRRAQKTPPPLGAAGGGSMGPPPDVQAQLAPVLVAADRYFEGGQYAQAQEALEQALELWPAEPVARFKLGMLLQQGQRPDLALPHLEKAATLIAPSHPMRPDLLGALGRLQLHTVKSRPQGADRLAMASAGVGHLTEALALRPTLTKQDPALQRLLAQAQAAELEGQRKAPKYDAGWAEGTSWAEDPEFAATLAAAGIVAGDGTGTVERREVGSLEWAEFRDRYRGDRDGTVGRPVLLGNVTVGWGAHGKLWDKPSLLERFGGVSAAVRWSVGTRQFGLIEREETLGRYVAAISGALERGGGQEPAEQRERAGMLFGNLCDVEQLDGCSLGLGEAEAVTAEWWHPPLMAAGGVTNPGISIGPSRGGLPWHNHDAAWQAVARGAKLFLLLPPLRPPALEKAEDVSKAMGEKLGRVLLPHPRDFVLSRLGKDAGDGSMADVEEIWANSGDGKPSEGGDSSVMQWVVVMPGDALFIPCNWWHATLNIGETVAVGGQQAGAGPEGGSCPRDLYHEAADAMSAVSRGLQGRGGKLQPAEASEGLAAVATACAALQWNVHCDSLRAELLALAQRGDEAVAVIELLAARMRTAHKEQAVLSSVQLSAVLDTLAESLLVLPNGPHHVGTAAAMALLDEAETLEPVHNLRAPVFKTLLARQLVPNQPNQEYERAAAAAIERGEEGAPAAFWYRFAGAQGGASVAKLRARLGVPPKDGSGDKAKGKKARRKGKRKGK